MIWLYTIAAVALTAGASRTPPTTIPDDVCHLDLDQVATFWNQLLSVAGCAQDTSILDVADSEELEPMVHELERGLAPSLRLDLMIIASGPDDVAIRAASQIGMSELALVTRARASIAMTPQAGRLHRELEPLLHHALVTARLAFRGIDRAAAEQPQAIHDPVTAHVVRNARSMLRLLGPSSEEDRYPGMRSAVTSLHVDH